MGKCEKAFLGIVGKTDPDSVKKRTNAKEEFIKSVDTNVDNMLEGMKLGRLDVYRGLVLGLIHEANVDKDIVKQAMVLKKAIDEFDKAKPDVVAVLESNIGEREKEIKSAQRNKLLGGILLAVVGGVVACLGFNSMLNKLAEAGKLEHTWDNMRIRQILEDSGFLSGAVGLIGGIGGAIGYIFATESKDVGKVDEKKFAEFAETCKTNSDTLLTTLQEFVQALPREMGEEIAPEFVKDLAEKRKQEQEQKQEIGM